MAGFTENALVRKLQELNSSQQSIQTLSLWLIHHRKHHAVVVKTWFKEILKGNLQSYFLYNFRFCLMSKLTDHYLFRSVGHLRGVEGDVTVSKMVSTDSV